MSDERPTQNQGQTSSTDDTVTTGTLPETGTNNMILIIIWGIGILAVIFYIIMRKKLFKNSKNE